MRARPRGAAGLRGAAVVLALVLGGAGCAACDRDAEEGIAEDPAEAAATTEREASEDPSRPARVRYDLVAAVPRAELRRGDTLVMDLGVPGDAKYTLGGWQTRTGEGAVIDGTTALLVPGATAKLVVPVETDRAHTLWLRGRAFGDGRVTVYVGDETVAHVELPTDGFGVARVDLSAEQLPVGEHFLQLRVPSTGWADGIGRAGMALDWLQVAPAGTAEPTAPPTPDVLSSTEGGVPTLAVPQGWRLGYAYEPPSGGRIRALLRGEGTLRIAVHRDGAGAPAVERFEASPEGTGVDLDLDPYAGEVVRIDLQAEGGDATLVRPAVVTLDGPDGEDVEVPRPRNVLVYLIDTLRADKLSPYDPETRVRTPALDGFARDAAVFAHAQSEANWTKPACATLLTGLLPWEHTATDSEAVLPGSVDMLSERLREDGFFTGSFIANGYVSDKFGFRQGWSTYRNYIREGRRTQASFLAADVLEWLDARPEEDPFFLYVHAIDPHVPYIVPDEILHQYDDQPYDGPVNFVQNRLTLEDIKAGKLRVNGRDRERLEALYDGEITYHDRHMASILDGLERRGLADDTLVVVTSDHGEEFFDHDSVGHGHSVYQELLHVPLLVRWPGVTDGAVRVGETVGLVDVMPTVLEALGMSIPEEMAGRSLLPLLRGRAEALPRIGVSAFGVGWRAVRVGRYKLIHRTADHWMLFDLVADPGEQRDLSGERPLTVRYMRGLLGLALDGDARGTPRRDARHEAEQTAIDAETEAQLRALGYVGDSRP